MKEKRIYTKYSNERDRKFAIRTEILENSGGKFLRKTAVFSEGREHIRHLHDVYEKLEQQYCRTGYSANKCHLEDETGKSVDLQYVEAQTLAELLDRMILDGQIAEAKDRLSRYLNNMRQMHSEMDFVMTDEFRMVFGEVFLPEGLKSGVITNIDPLCQNLLMAEVPVIIDYEWTFEFPIPCEYVLYRIIHYYVCAGTGHKELDEKELLEQYGISGELEEQFEQMERSFQKYLIGDYVPMRELYHEMSPGIQAFSLEEPLSVQVFFGRPGVYSEESSTKTTVFGQEVDQEYDIPEGTSSIRIDPENGPCIVRVREVRIGEEVIDLRKFPSNGILLKEQSYVFAIEDPWISEIPVPESSRKLHLQMQVMPLKIGQSLVLKDLAEERSGLFHRIGEQEQELAKIEPLIRAQEQELKQKEAFIGAQEQELAEKETLIRAQEQEINAKREHISQLDQARLEAAQTITGLQDVVHALEVQLAQKQEQITQMENTKIWKMYEKYKRTVRR